MGAAKGEAESFPLQARRMLSRIEAVRKPLLPWNGRSGCGDAASASRVGAAKGRSGILSASSEKDAVQN